MRVACELAFLGIAVRRLKSKPARAALERARQAARDAGIPALSAEVESAGNALSRPAARVVGRSQNRLLLLDEVETTLSSPALVVDGCRNMVWNEGQATSLAKRPVLFALAAALAEAWPADVSRDVLVARAFGGKQADESHRARLRVEVGRLRAELRTIADIKATKRGFALRPLRACDVVVLAPPVDEAHAPMLALLADGEAWASSALALALGTSARTVQRTLERLAAEGKVQSVGRGRSRRWMAPQVPGFPTSLLLHTPLPNG